MKLSKKFFANLSLICLVLVFVIMVGKFGNVKATSYSVNSTNCFMTGDVTLNKTTYSPGEQITASATAFMNNVNGASCLGAVTASNNGNVTYQTVIYNITGGSANGQTYFTAPLGGGTYTIWFNATNNGVSTPASVMYAVSTGGGGGTPVVNVWATNMGGNTITTSTYGQAINIHWTSSNGTTSCGASQNGTSVPNAGTGVSGNFTQGPIVDTIYTVNCSNGTNVGSGSLNIKVIPSVTVTPNPAQIISGNSSNVGWTSQGASSCTSASGGGTGVAGNFTVSPTATTSYEVSCSEATQVTPGSCSGTYQTTATVCQPLYYANSTVYTNMIPSPYNGVPLGTGTVFCNGKASQSTCTSAQASNGSDPVESFCEWTPASSCAGEVAGSICSGGGSPHEGEDCSQFSQSACPGTGDPWCHHGCHWNYGSNPITCSGLSQTSCNSHSTCVWAAGSTIPGDSNTSSGLVIVSDGTVPVVTLNSLKTVVSSGETTDVSWTSLNATSCNLVSPVLSPQPSGLTATFSTGQLYQNTTYDVLCTNSAGIQGTDSLIVSVVPAIMPELLVTGYNIPSSAVVDTNVTLVATIGNGGGVITPTDFYNFFQVTDIEPGAPTALLNKSKNSLMALLFPRAFASMGLIDLSSVFMDSLGSQSEDTTTKTYKFTAEGDYWVRACADKTSRNGGGLINESNESNNCGIWNHIVINPVTPKPDLIAAVVTPSTAILGTPTTFNSVIKNQGNSSTGAGFSNFFQVTDSDPSSPNALLNKHKGSLFSSLVPKAYAFPGITDITPSIPMTTLAASATNISSLSGYNGFEHTGTYWIRACADKTSSAGGGVITESREVNNCGAWTTVTVVDAGQPDLTAGGIYPTTATVSTFGVTFHAVVSNIGVVSTGTGFKNFAQVSLSPTHTPAQDLPSIFMGPVNSNSTGLMSVSHRFTTAGVYYARVCADMSNRNTTHTSNPPDSVDESNENNNCGPWTTITITAPSTTGSISASDCIVSAGLDSCDSKISWNTVNPQAGHTSSVTTPVGITIKTANSGIDTYPILIKDGNRNFYLYHNIVKLDEANAKATCEKGTVYDDKNFICKSPDPLDSKSDLTASSVGPLVVAPGDPFKYFASIQNIGDGSTKNSFWNIFQISDNPDGSGSEVLNPDVQITPYLGAHSGMTIFSGESYSLAMNDVKYVRACADENKQFIKEISESNEDNNCGPWTQITVAESFDGQCSTTHWNCIKGNPVSPITGSTSYTWKCSGAGTGSTANCSEVIPVCPSGTTGTPPNCICDNPLFISPACNVCINGGTYPTCDNPTICPAGTTGTPPNCICDNPLFISPACNTCINGGTYPTCINPANCTNPLLMNYPACDKCINQSNNPPICNNPPNVCTNPLLTNYPACDTCTNGAVNPPVCTIDAAGKCLNGKTYPPLCGKKVPTYKER